MRSLCLLFFILAALPMTAKQSRAEDAVQRRAKEARAPYVEAMKSVLNKPRPNSSTRKSLEQARSSADRIWSSQPIPVQPKKASPQKQPQVQAAGSPTARTAQPSGRPARPKAIVEPVEVPPQEGIELRYPGKQR